ncbi:hypothetical protein HRbin02_01074 [Candidatus Calditenuaceae archaeon HR02]|nr:hypothetical protein HRbin02_01074 [Candidatus Calditenuaceae archaeon HR02]
MRVKEPKIIIAWPYADEDHKEYAKALTDLKIIDEYTVLPDNSGILLVSYRDRLVIRPQDIANMFELTLGFAPEDIIEETWFETFQDVRRGKKVKYTLDEIIIEAED